jgi:hypothetical protein
VNPKRGGIRRGILACEYSGSDGGEDRMLMRFRYFCNPNAEATIEALPGTYEKDEDKMWPAIRADEYLVQRLTQTYSY